MMATGVADQGLKLILRTGLLYFGGLGPSFMVFFVPPPWLSFDFSEVFVVVLTNEAHKIYINQVGARRRDSGRLSRETVRHERE